MKTSKAFQVDGDYDLQPIYPTNDGYGFNVVGKRLTRLVHFSYATEEEAKEAWPLVNWATLKALAIVPYSRPSNGIEAKRDDPVGKRNPNGAARWPTASR